MRFLVCHGANLEYVDHALRNALYWSVYSACAEITVFLLEAGARAKPWSWLEDEALPVSILEDSFCVSYIRNARNSPPSLKILARRTARNWVLEMSNKKSVFPVIDRLKITDRQRAWLKLNDVRASTFVKSKK